MPFQIFRPWLAHSAPHLFQSTPSRRSLPQIPVALGTWAFGAALSVVASSGVITRLEDLAARLERLEAASGGQLTLANRIEALRQEIERLRGELEVQTNELAATQRRLRDQYAEVDSRVKRFEPIQVTVDGQSFSVDPMERRTFDGALSLFRAGEFRNALISFDGLIANYPQTPYAIQAAYWSGSAQYALKDWKSAAETLQALIRRHPNHPRVPDASLRLGAALLELGDYRLARRTWESLIERFRKRLRHASACRRRWNPRLRHQRYWRHLEDPPANNRAMPPPVPVGLQLVQAHSWHRCHLRWARHRVPLHSLPPVHLPTGYNRRLPRNLLHSKHCQSTRNAKSGGGLNQRPNPTRFNDTRLI